MTEKYYSHINQLAKIGFDDADDPSYCDIWDRETSSFKRSNNLLDEILNHPETLEITREAFERGLMDDTSSGPAFSHN